MTSKYDDFEDKDALSAKFTREVKKLIAEGEVRGFAKGFDSALQQQKDALTCILMAKGMDSKFIAEVVAAVEAALKLAKNNQANEIHYQE